MKPIDRIMKDNVPGYSYMKKAMPQVGAGREGVNPGLTMRGAFFTHWQRREPFEAARRSLEDSGICPVFQTVINYNPKVPESTLEEKPLCVYAPRSWAAIQYKKLTAEYKSYCTDKIYNLLQTHDFCRDPKSPWAWRCIPKAKEG